jgi:TonB family protein
VELKEPPAHEVLPDARQHVGSNGAHHLWQSAQVDDSGLDRLLVDSAFEPWFVSFKRQVRDLIQGNDKLPPPPQYRPAYEGEDTLGPLVIHSVHRPWYKTLQLSVRDLSEEKKLPPLRLTSKPVRVKSIWGAYDNKQKGVLSSLSTHVAVVALVFGLSASQTVHEMVSTGSVTLIIPVDISPYMLDLKMKTPNEGKSGGGGGGGQNSPLPASKGRLPRFSLQQFAPPTPVITNPNPKLAVEPTLLGPPDLQVPNVDMAVFGDPLGQIGPPSAGTGSGGGIGSGTGTGVGPGRGGGYGPGSGGGAGGGVFRVGGGVSAPALIKKVEPEYSEEARKAKYQGTVVLAVQVWEDGRAHNIRIVRSLGLGLDEKAVQAVEKWRFRPGKKDNKPVKVAATIEVNFRLL